MWVAVWFFRMGARRSWGQKKGKKKEDGGQATENEKETRREKGNTSQSETHLIVSANNLISNVQLSLRQHSDMKDVSAEDLDVRDEELGLPVDDDGSGISLLSSGLGVEVGSIEKETDGWGRGREGRGGRKEGRGVVDSLERRGDGGGSC